MPASYGGFEEWSQRIPEPLLWPGQADPCVTVSKVRENDPERDRLQTILLQWQEHLGLHDSIRFSSLSGGR